MSSLRKADLHLHTYHSGWQRLPLIDALDCYLDPVSVVETALRRGMDYVALTDHDSIGGWIELHRRRPDLWKHVIPGVEVETRFPGWGLKVHVNLLGIDERQFRELAFRKHDLHALLGYARLEGIVAILNHPLRTLWGRPNVRRFVEHIPALFDGFEVLNSASPEVGNRAALALAARGGSPRILVGGSDAHTLPRVAAAFTIAEGETRDDFLASVRSGACEPGGAACSGAAVIADIYRVVGQYYASLWSTLRRGSHARWARNQIAAALLLPGAALMPALVGGLNELQYRF
ncbi:MAG: hypothetical protein L0099_00885, partial [Acidobacteria bacterium]|nr:hypothetical protein [Acidobacteriota bacterium]